MGNKKRIYSLVGIVIAIILLFITTIGSQISGDKIVKNTYINNTNISNLTKTQAKLELEKIYNIDNLEFNYMDKSWKIDTKKIDLSYNIDKTIEDAYNLNRSGNFIEDITKTIKSNLGEKNKVKLEVNYNEEKLKNEIIEIAKDVDQDVQDARISINGSSVNVKESKSGLKVNIEDTLNNIATKLKKGNGKEELVVSKVEPNIKTEQLQEVNTLLGSYTTKFNSGVAGRSTNIRLSANRTNDILLMPGDTFSYNKATGKRTVDNGYKDAPVIVQGVMQEGIGGGVCQVSTTLYNATLYAGLEYVELRNHSIAPSYVSKGRDATVTDSGIDFVFKNNLNHPIYIKNYVSGNTVTCQIYGSSKDKQNIQIETNTDNVSKAPTKKVDDPTILKGEEKVMEKGRDGYTVSTYRIYKDKQGNVIKKEKVAKSYYPKKQGVIAVGTMEKPVEEKPVVPPVDQPQENQPSKDINSEITQPGDVQENNSPEVPIQQNN